jgi:hypothetical protein
VLDDAVVDFVFVAMIDVVEQVKMFHFIANVGMFFLDFFYFFTQVPYPILLPILITQKKRNFQGEIR